MAILDKKMSRFYLGTHRPHWLKTAEIPLFVSHRTLKKYKNLFPANHQWALDSGGFTELHKYGKWKTTEKQYIQAVKRYDNEIGSLNWCAPMDWMCETTALKQTGLTVEDHQKRTVENFLNLRQQLGTKVVPVLQGWEPDDYLKHVDDYSKHINLEEEQTVGLGSVCRRHSENQICKIIHQLQPIKLHAFGVKGAVFGKIHEYITSADSLAWSFTARYSDPLIGCTHKTCTNCYLFALKWREKTLQTANQARLFV